MAIKEKNLIGSLDESLNRKLIYNTIMNIKYCRMQRVLHCLYVVWDLNQQLCLLCKLNPSLIALKGLYNGRAASSRLCACFILPRAKRFHNKTSKC